MKTQTAVILVILAAVGVVVYYLLTRPAPPKPVDPATAALNSVLAVPGQIVNTVKDALGGVLHISIGF
jgi:hypothetical protein